MFYKKTMLLGLICLLGFPFSTAMGKLSGRDIMVKADNIDDGKDRRIEMEMELVNKRGKKRFRQMVLLSKDYGKDVKSVFFVKKPADVRGTGFLVWSYDNPSRDDDRWLYLPALKRSKRISGSSKNDSFMGSDMTYDDMGDRSVDEDRHKLLREEELAGHDCWVVQSIPKERDSLYSKKVFWVRKDNSIVIKGLFYDRRGKLLKVMERKNIKKVQGLWTVFLSEMKNVQDNHKTFLRLKKVKYNMGLRNSFFKISTVERGRIR